MKRAIFITGTDTGVGKTVVAGLLGRFLIEKKIDVITQKWIQTGCSSFSDDVAFHLEMMGKTEKDISPYLSDVTPYILSFPSSPHLAAEIAGKHIDTARIEESFYTLQKDFEVVLVEGSGGLMVPINEEKMMIDVVRKLNLPVLIVAENKLGAINQTVLTVEALRRRDMQILGIVFDRCSEGGDEQILKDNPKIIRKLTGVEVLGEAPFTKDIAELYKAFRPIGQKILQAL